jgi:hypothetical protein
MNLLWLRILVAVAAVVLAVVAFYPVLALQWSRRLVLLLALAGLAALTPFLLPPEWLLPRFALALFAGVMIMKMWDLHIGAENGSRPDFREFLGFIASPALLVWRKRAQGRASSAADNGRDLVLAALGGAGAIAALFLLEQVDWSGVPFLLQHAPIAVALFLLVTALLDSTVALTRLLGGPVIDANDRPLAARTPAEFWRRYNRLVGQFLHEDFFKPMRGLRHPVRSTLAVFAVSGVLHEYLFWMAVGHSAGLQMMFFMLQGCGVALTLRVKPTGLPAMAWMFGTFVFNALTSVFFFASIHLVLPLYQGGLPAWLRDW